MHKKLPMSFSERHKYLLLMKSRYKKAPKKEKHILLNEMQQVTGLHRKSIIRLMNAPSLTTECRPRALHKDDNNLCGRRSAFLLAPA